MITQNLFKKYKLTSEDLRAKFSAAKRKKGDSDPNATSRDKLAASNVTPVRPQYSPDVDKLVQRIQQRITDGVNRSLSEAKIYWAIDKAFDVAFSQIPVSLVESLMDRDADDSRVQNALNEWGLTHLLTPVSCTCASTTACNCGASAGKKVLNLPVFFKILLPLVKAYVTIRWAKIYTDRNVYPLYKIEPLRSTALNRLRSEILTDRIQVMAEQLGYASVMRQEIFQALLYSFAFSFPKEHWYKEEQTFVDEKDKEFERVIREGVRYNIPHPTRVAVDPSDRPSTFNTDSGCSYALYWNLVPWGSVQRNEAYWNKDAVSYGENLISKYPSYFEEIFPCSLRFPDSTTAKPDVEGATSSADRQLRDEYLGSYYTSTDDDKAVTLVEYFEKLVPSENGLGDYSHPLWFRFVVAGDSTIVYAEPMSYTPVIYTGYDADENRARNASLALEVMPFQDHLGNLLTQYILSVKSNLTKVVFYDKDIVDGTQISRVDNLGEKRYRGTTFIPFSGREMAMSQHDVRRAFESVQFPIQSTQEIAASISTIINILERLLAMSSQELGQPATHEQTANEITVISNNVTTRLTFTASFVDDASQARKIQLYNALMANGSEEIYAQIQTDRPIDEKLLEQIGFEVVESNAADKEKTAGTATQVSGLGEDSLVIRGSKNGLLMEGFASNREGENRVNGPQVALAMSNMLQSFSNASSILYQVLGPEQVVKLFNQMFTIAGVPHDFRLKPMPPPPREVTAEELAKQFQAIQKEMATALSRSQDGIMTQIGKVMAQMRANLEGLAKNDDNQNKTIAQIVGQLQQVAGFAPPILNPNETPNGTNPQAGAGEAAPLA